MRAMLNAGLVLLIAGGAWYAWTDLRALEAADAKLAARDAVELAKLQQLRGVPAGPSSNPAPLSRDEPAPAGRAPSGASAAALGVVANLALRGILATPDPQDFRRTPAAMRIPTPPYMIDPAGKLPPGFAEFYQIGPERFAALETAYAGFVDEIDRGLLANTRVSLDANGATVLESTPLPNSAELRAGFEAMFKEALGGEGEGYDLFVRLNSTSRLGGRGATGTMGGIMNFFGDATTTYTVTARPGGGVSVNYRITSGTGSGAGGGGGGLSGTGSVRDQLIFSHGPIMKLLPAGFGG